MLIRILFVYLLRTSKSISMKKILIFSTLVLLSCKKDPDPEPTPTPTSVAPKMQGDWLWVKSSTVYYQNSLNTGEVVVPISGGSSQTFSSNGKIYPTGSTVQMGTYVEGTSATYTVSTPVTMYLSKLTADSLVLKEYPNGCVTCTSLEYYFVK